MIGACYYGERAKSSGPAIDQAYLKKSLSLGRADRDHPDRRAIRRGDEEATTRSSAG
jgi:hypothetical protein